MSLNLEKNQSLNLTKASDRLLRVKASLSWQTPENVFPSYDLDVCAFMLGESGKLLSDEGFIFYNQPAAVDGSVVSSGDETSGGTEDITIDIAKLNPAVAEISIVVTIHKAVDRKQHFKKVTGAMLEIFNVDTGEKLAVFKLSDAPIEATAVIVGSFYQTADGFTFTGVEQYYQLELESILDGYRS